jgi:HD-GYP domain-containing protein (c-di-GMP phosphodiesterase class II)
MPAGFFSYYALPLIAKNQIKGVLETFCRTALESDDEWCGFAATLAGQAAIAIDSAQLLTALTKTNTELRLAYETTLEGWSRALDLRDNETQGHTARVAGLTVLLGQALGMDAEEMLHLRRGALLHDIGKMGIPDAILLKPGPLTEEEWEVMRRHPVYSYELLSPISYLRPALDIPHLHHERWDGGGYPLGLKGEEIPLAARVFAVVDVWDALTSDRPYRRKVPVDRARQIIRDGAGKDFDPRIVEVFLKLDLSLGNSAARNARSG